MDTPHKLKQSVITLTRLAEQMASRFERTAADEDGKIDPDDVKLIAKLRTQIDKVLSEPMKEFFQTQGEKS